MRLGEDNPVRGVSIGFVRLAGGQPTKEEVATYGPVEYVTREWRWLEYSVTPQPCNPGCSITSAEAAKGTPLDDDTARRIDGLRSKGIIHRKTAEALGVVLKTPKMIVVPTQIRF